MFLRNISLLQFTTRRGWRIAICVLQDKLLSQEFITAPAGVRETQ